MFLLFQTTVFAQSQADSASLIRNKALNDSVKNREDSLSLAGIKASDPNSSNQFSDSFTDISKVEKPGLNSILKKNHGKINQYNEGKPRPKGEAWIMAVILFLLLFFSIIKNAFSKELASILESFYNNRTLSQINKEDNLFSSWPFLFLYLLFGLTIGMYLYLSGRYFELEYQFDGFQWFLVLSALVIGLFALKIIALRLLGVLFNIQRLVREYVSVLYLTYFNVAILFLPLIIAFSLTPNHYAGIDIYLAVLLIVFVFLWQFLRTGSTILSNYQFPKAYLIIYLCALEICPLLILIKVLRF